MRHLSSSVKKQIQRAVAAGVTHAELARIWDVDVSTIARALRCTAPFGWAQAAARLGIDVDTYQREREAGNLWCRFGRHWTPREKWVDGVACIGCPSRSSPCRKSGIKAPEVVLVGSECRGVACLSGCGAD